MYYSYVEIEYVATSFPPARTDLALKLLTATVSPSWALRVDLLILLHSFLLASFSMIPVIFEMQTTFPRRFAFFTKPFWNFSRKKGLFFLSILILCLQTKNSVFCLSLVIRQGSFTPQVLHSWNRLHGSQVLTDRKVCTCFRSHRWCIHTLEYGD
jgi:hypothetical protein